MGEENRGGTLWDREGSRGEGSRGGGEGKGMEQGRVEQRRGGGVGGV